MHLIAVVINAAGLEAHFRQGAATVEIPPNDGRDIGGIDGFPSAQADVADPAEAVKTAGCKPPAVKHVGTGRTLAHHQRIAGCIRNGSNVDLSLRVAVAAHQNAALVTHWKCAARIGILPLDAVHSQIVSESNWHRHVAERFIYHYQVARLGRTSICFHGSTNSGMATARVRPIVKIIAWSKPEPARGRREAHRVALVFPGDGLVPQIILFDEG